MMNLSILGSTGSIGKTTLDIVSKHSSEFKVLSLAAHSNISLLEKQALIFKPKLIAVWNPEKAAILQKKLKSKRIKVVSEADGLIAAATIKASERAVFALNGINGLIPLLAAIEEKKDIAIANKEVLVIAGEIIKKAVRKHKVLFVPIDSEHSAIFQCLHGHAKNDLKKMIITASGGPFLQTNKQDFSKITPQQALKHPKWKMGRKITIDSATMMNKGLEVIEAARLYDVDLSKIEVIVHPQSIIHSFVEYVDGSVLAQLADTNMAFPIMYALAYPKRMISKFKGLSLSKIGALTFERPDMKKFKCLALAYKAGKIGGTMTTVLNASNEIAVDKFLSSHIRFDQIPVIIEKIMKKHTAIENASLNKILKIDQWAREEALKLC